MDVIKGGNKISLEYKFEGKENAIVAKHLMVGEVCKITGFGNSMTPILASGQPVICIPVKEDTLLEKNDIVLCKVNGKYYLHKISSIKGNGKLYQISNNHGHVNGTVSRRNIFGKVVEKL